LRTDDLAAGDNHFFAAPGITDGELLRGVRYVGDRATTQSLVMLSRSGTVRTVDAVQRLSKLDRYASLHRDEASSR
jgi:fructose-1,6-bisphosphatase II